jgi:hypothetical protein
VEVAVHLTPEGRQTLEARLALRPTRYGRFLCGTERNGAWSSFLGVTTIYDPRHGSLVYDFHPHEPGGFASLCSWQELVSGELNRRVSLGLTFDGWPTVKRADVGVDFGFRDPELGRAFYEGLRDRRYTKGRRVQERQSGWFSIFGRGTRSPVLHGRVYDKGVQSGKCVPWRWLRTERVVRWERRDAMRLSLLTPGALRHSYCDVFSAGLASGVPIRGDQLVEHLLRDVVDGLLTVREYETLAGYVLAERAGLVAAVYSGRPDKVSRSESLARELGMMRSGAKSSTSEPIDLHEVVVAGGELLGAGV